MTYWCTYHSPIGDMTMASDGIHLTGLWFDGQKYDRSTLDQTAIHNGQLQLFADTKRWLDLYFSGKQPDFTPALMVNGSAFRQMVIQSLLAIPYGQTMTYGEIARKIASSMGNAHLSAQAVGGAVGHNPISIIVPCHRVVGSNGALTGYAGGLERKAWLLEQEAAHSKSIH